MKLVAPVIGLMLLVACSGCGKVDTTGMVCDDFALFAKSGQPRDQRSQLVSDIAVLIDDANPKVKAKFPLLTKHVDAPAITWSVAADVFAQSCFDAGWTG